MADNITIAIVAPRQPEDFFDLLWQGVWEATFDLSSFGVEVQNLTTQLDDVPSQRRVLEMLLESRPDAIGVLPVHASALDDLIDQHVERGTHVITFHGDAPASRRDAFVRPDPYQAGMLAGEVLGKILQGSGPILSFPGSEARFHLVERYRGFQDALRRFGNIDEVARPWNPSASSEITLESLQARGPIAGYYVGNEDLVRIATRFEELGLQLPCVGFSKTDRVQALLQRGLISAVIDENRYQVGYFAVQKAYQTTIRGASGPPVGSISIPSTVVFAANATAEGDALDSAFELLVRQRTETLVSYKNRLEEANAKLLDLAVTDPLTGLYNRRKFEDAIQQEASRALRYGPVSLLIVDLNDFKSVNDRHGHQAGDDVLKAVAQVLRSSCRTTDTCARFGGDEFAIILPHSGPSAARVVCQRIQNTIAHTAVAIPNGELKTSLSIGMATLPGDADSAEDLIAAADASMYQVKQGSRLEHVS